MVGPNTFAPLTWICKKQGAVSHSSTEAEIVALDAGTRMEGIPCLMLWQQVISMYKSNNINNKETVNQSMSSSIDIYQFLSQVDYVPSKSTTIGI